MREIVCELKNVSKTFKNNQCCPIKAVDLKIQKGDYISIEGSSGIGKSTLLYIIGCLIEPTSGEIFYYGKKIENYTEHFLLPIRRRYISYIFQDYRYIELFTVKENLMFAGRYRNISQEELKHEVKYYLEKLDLQNKEDAYPYNLSGGQKRRLMIALALIKDAQIIIADEPTNDLDLSMEETILDLFEQKISEGKTIILSTHNLRVSQRVHLRYQIKNSKLSVIGGEEDGK